MDLLPFSLVVLAAILVITAARQLFRFNLRIWQIMAAGAGLLIVTGQISLPDALAAVSIPVMVFLFSMFVLGEALSRSGYLQTLSSFFFRKAHNGGALVMLVLAWCGLLSGLLLNDTLAIIGTPLMLMYARHTGMKASLLLITLAFAVTTGSMFSPLGSPQALLIALEGGFSEPFGVFFLYLGFPAAAGLGLCYLFLRWYYPGEMVKRVTPPPCIGVPDPELTQLVKISLCLFIVLIVVCSILTLVSPARSLPLSLVAFIAILPMLLFSRRRVEILSNTDWFTLVFFAALFIVTAAVWSTGVVQSLVPPESFISVPFLLATSLLISQFISNVPFVALVMPLLSDTMSGVPAMMALAAGSTLAGNLTIMGAASNIIIIQRAEREGETISFFEFLKIGLPLTFAQAIVCLAWFRILAFTGLG
jgi:Na+/H+ antiporter NhaD/arsenite permease-like protein